MSAPTRQMTYTPADIVALTVRGKQSVMDALQAGMLAGKQNSSRRGERWVITQRALDDWIDRGCPFPPRAKRYPKRSKGQHV